MRPAMRLTKHDPATRRASGGAPRSKGPYSMRRGYHLSSSCGGAERPSSAAYAPPVQHGGDQTCSQRAPCTPPPLVATATASSRSMANVTAASGTFNRIGACYCIGVLTPCQPSPRTKYTPLERPRASPPRSAHAMYPMEPAAMHNTPPPLPLASATTIATTAGSRGAGLPRYPSPHRSHPHQITGARCKPDMSELGTRCRALQRVGHCCQANSHPWPYFVDLVHKSGSTHAGTEVCSR